MITSELKQLLQNLLSKVQVSGTPGTPDFEKALKQYNDLKQFIDGLEVSEN